MTISSNTANSSTALTLCPVNRTRHLCCYTINASGRITAKFVFFAFLVLFCAFEIQSKCPSSSALQRTKGQNRAKRERSGAAGNQSPKRKLKWSWKSKLPCQNDAFTTKYWGWSAGGRWKEIAEKWRQSTEVGQQEGEQTNYPKIFPPFLNSSPGKNRSFQESIFHVLCNTMVKFLKMSTLLFSLAK